jgi:tetratricopeptide (TPR) repeat protein
MYTVFRIESVEQIIGNSITMWAVKLTLVVDDDPQLLRIVSPLRSTEVNANPLSYLGKLCMDKGDYEQAERFFLGMLQDPSVLNQPFRLARVQRGLGANYMDKHEYAKALEHYEQALKASLSFLSPEHTDLVPLYDGIGNSYYKQGDYVKALENYGKAANLLEHSKQPLNEQCLNDLNLRIGNIKKLLITKQLL